MSSDHQATLMQPPYAINLSSTLSDADQHTIANLLALLPTDAVSDVQLKETTNAERSSVYIKHFVDGRGLACPMPLLKTKVALREVANNESLYIVATDPNSQADITAFCQQSQQVGAAIPLLLTLNQSTQPSATPAAESTTNRPSDTIYHFIITKTDSN